MNYNKVISERQDRGEVFTPITLVEEMLDKLPKEVFESKTTTFLDPCFGTGTFLKAIGLRLKSAGHSSENINSRLFGFEVDSRMFNETKAKMPYINISKEDFLKTDIDMKFDVIVGNPPYQKDEHSSQKLWKTFLIRSMNNYLKDGGLLSLVIPTSWTKPVRSTIKGEDKELSIIVRSNTILDYDLDVNKYFNVGIDISTITLKKDGLDNNFVFLHKDTIGSSIFTKLINSKHDRLKLLHYVNTPWNRGIVRKQVQTNQHNIKLIEGFNKFSYCTEDDIILRSKNKIHIPRVFGFNFIPDAGECGLGYQAECIVLCDNETLESAMSFFDSALVKTILKNVKWIPQADYSVLEMFPKLDYDHVYSSTELYTIFSLTQEEIEYVENAVK